MSQYHVHRVALAVCGADVNWVTVSGRTVYQVFTKSSGDCGEEISNVRNTAAVNTTSTVKRFLYLEISL